jgi:LemA protein
METLIVIGVLVVVIGYAMSIYNNIIKLKEYVHNAKSQISVQLDRRGKIFDSLISTVTKAMDYEKTALKEVIELRQKAISLQSNGDAMNNAELKSIEDQMSKMMASGAFNSSFNMTMEAYPDLKANENMLQLQEEIVSTENKLSFAKQSLNDSITKYNLTTKSVPDVFVVNMFAGALKEEFEMWVLSEDKIQQQEEKTVSFG